MISVIKQGKPDVFDIATPSTSTRKQICKGTPWMLNRFPSGYRKRPSYFLNINNVANYNYWFDTLWGNVDFAVVLDKLIVCVEAKMPSVKDLCENYLNMANTVEVVKQILIVEDEEGFTIWTVIEAEPFDDSLRKPIYQAQIDMLRQIEDDKPIDFHILNILEYTNLEALQDVIPHNAKIIWQR